MLMTRSQFKRQLQLGLNANFGLEYKRYPEEWRGLFDVESSMKAYEEDALLSGFGAAPVKAEGAGVQYDSGQEAWVARYVHETIALAFAITQEAQEDGLYGKLGAKYSRALARSMQHTKEIKGAAIFNNGFDSNYPGGDGVQLFSTAHPLVGGGTLSNTLSSAADLSEAAIEDALLQIEGWTDERGIPINIQGVKLAIPRQLKFEAHRILRSTKRVDTANNDANALRDMDMLPGGTVVNHRFSDADSWFILTDCPDGLKHFVRRKISSGVEGDFATGNLRYKTDERYVFGWTNWRGGFGVQGA